MRPCFLALAEPFFEKNPEERRGDPTVSVTDYAG
ncbi:uncharacterized protein G2W53_019613 [Senna tora]|uniref:Uncharacterized protein n=1 Tax=Senna tora TaxID=362788 RepID=A0A834U2B5_9FABA|nr:uncharacterized protein G2W53_019613 [Senna tora]